MISTWQYKYGDQIVQISPSDVIEALAAAESIMLKEVEANRHIKENVQMKLLYEHYMNVLSVTKDHFSGAIEEDRKKHLRMKNPGGKR